MSFGREYIGRVLVWIGTFLLGVKQLILSRLLLHPLLVAEQSLHRLGGLLSLQQLLRPGWLLLNFENTGLYPSTYEFHHIPSSPLSHLPTILLPLLGKEVDEVLSLQLLLSDELVFILLLRHHII